MGTCNPTKSPHVVRLVVYLLHSETNGLYKIGMSKCAQKRAVGIKSISGQTVGIVHTIPHPQTPQLEAYLHERFRGRRVKGEWFRLSVSGVDEIRSITPDSASGLIDVVRGEDDGVPTVVRQFAANLRARRESAGLSMMDLADLSGLTRQGIHLLEARLNDPRLSTVHRLADALRCSVADLVAPD